MARFALKTSCSLGFICNWLVVVEQPASLGLSRSIRASPKQAMRLAFWPSSVHNIQILLCLVCEGSVICGGSSEKDVPTRVKASKQAVDRSICHGSRGSDLGAALQKVSGARQTQCQGSQRCRLPRGRPHGHVTSLPPLCKGHLTLEAWPAHHLCPRWRSMPPVGGNCKHLWLQRWLRRC